MKPFTLPQKVPFKGIWKKFAKEYDACPTYWYIPKGRALNDENVKFVKLFLETLFDEYLDLPWDHDTQSKLLARLIEKGALEPT